MMLSSEEQAELDDRNRIPSEAENTPRGFSYVQFKDLNGVECTIQESSLALEDAIWIGANKIGLKEFVANRQPSAWQDVALEQTYEHHYIANNRMHLTRDQVAALIPVLQRFVDTGIVTGDFKEKSPESFLND